MHIPRLVLCITFVVAASCVFTAQPYSDELYRAVRPIPVIGTSRLTEVERYKGTVHDVVTNHLTEGVDVSFILNEFIVELCDHGAVYIAGPDWTPDVPFEVGPMFHCDYTDVSARWQMLKLCKLLYKETGKLNAVAQARMWHEPYEL